LHINNVMFDFESKRVVDI